MKQLIGHDTGSYAFNALAGTITFSGVSLTLDQILLVIDSTTSAILYAVGQSGLGGTLVGSVLTLEASTILLSNSNVLQIYVDVPIDLALETGGNLASAKSDLDTIAGAIASTKMKVSAAAGDVVVEVSDGSTVIGTTSHPVQTQDQSTKASTGSTAATAPTAAGEEGLIAATALPTAVTSGQLVGAMGDKFGRSINTMNGPRDLIGTASVQNTSATAATLIAAGGSDVYTDIIHLILTNESSTATIVSVTDGTTTYKFALAGNGGASIPFPTPLPAASSNTVWQASNSAAVNVDCVVIYVKNK